MPNFRNIPHPKKKKKSKPKESKSTTKHKLPPLKSNSVSVNNEGSRRDINFKLNTSDLMMQKYNQSIQKKKQHSPQKNRANLNRSQIPKERPSTLKLPDINRPINIQTPFADYNKNMLSSSQSALLPPKFRKPPRTIIKKRPKYRNEKLGSISSEPILMTHHAHTPTPNFALNVENLDFKSSGEVHDHDNIARPEITDHQLELNLSDSHSHMAPDEHPQLQKYKSHKLLSRKPKRSRLKQPNQLYINGDLTTRSRGGQQWNKSTVVIDLRPEDAKKKLSRMKDYWAHSVKK